MLSSPNVATEPDLVPVEQRGELRQRRCGPRLRPCDEVLLPDPTPCHRHFPSAAPWNRARRVASSTPRTGLINSVGHSPRWGRLFRSARTATGVAPDRVTTDGHDSYPKAIWRCLAYHRVSTDRENPLSDQGIPFCPLRTIPDTPAPAYFREAPSRAAQGGAKRCPAPGYSDPGAPGRSSCPPFARCGARRRHLKPSRRAGQARRTR